MANHSTVTKSENEHKHNIMFKNVVSCGALQDNATMQEEWKRLTCVSFHTGAEIASQPINAGSFI